MSRAIVYDRSILTARETCLRLRRKHRLAADAVHPTDFDSTFDGQGLPALIVTELQMPLFSGLELIRKLRSAYPEATLPIIAYTTVDDALTWEQATRLGADEIVVRQGSDPLLRLDAAVQRVLRRPTDAGISRQGFSLLRMLRPARLANSSLAAA